MKSRVRLIKILSLLLACPFIAALISAASPSPTEYQIKAAFLYNFAKFVEWPADAFASPDSPVIFGVIGDDPFGKDLEQVIGQKTVNFRPVVIKRFDTPTPSEPVHVLFIARSERRRIGQILTALANAPTLTVGDEIDRFTDAGGMINFVVESRKVRFEINNKAAEATRLKISSKLLRLSIGAQE